MKIGVLTIHGLGFHPNGRLDQAARYRGHRLMLINPYELICSLENQGPGIHGGNHTVTKDLPDVVLPRQGSPMGRIWVCDTPSVPGHGHSPGQ